MKFWEKFKAEVKPVVEIAEIKLDKDSQDIETEIKGKLDQNGDGMLTIDDIFYFAKKVIDKNGNGKAEIWEIITGLFAVYKFIKKIKS